VIQDVEYAPQLTASQLRQGLGELPGASADESRLVGIGPTLCLPLTATVATEAWNVLHRPVLRATALLRSRLADVLALNVAYCECPSRLNLLDRTGAGSPAEAPPNLLQALQRRLQATDVVRLGDYRDALKLGGR